MIIKELAQKAKALPKKEREVKAAEFDKLEEKKEELTQPPIVKKVIAVQETEEDNEKVERLHSQAYLQAYARKQVIVKKKTKTSS
jgi:hypothetical protein